MGQCTSSFQPPVLPPNQTSVLLWSVCLFAHRTTEWIHCSPNIHPDHATCTNHSYNQNKNFLKNYTNPHWSNNVCSACIWQHRTDLSHLMTRNQMRAWDERFCFVVCTHWDERFLDIKHIIENQQINQIWLAHIRATKIQIQIIRRITWFWLWINRFKFHMNPDYPLKNDQMNYTAEELSDFKTLWKIKVGKSYISY